MRVRRVEALPTVLSREEVAQLLAAVQAERQQNSERLARIEEIVTRERIVTLPQRGAAIRLASEAESASSPAAVACSIFVRASVTAFCSSSRAESSENQTPCP